MSVLPPPPVAGWDWAWGCDPHPGAVEPVQDDPPPAVGAMHSHPHRPSADHCDSHRQCVNGDCGFAHWMANHHRHPHPINHPSPSPYRPAGTHPHGHHADPPCPGNPCRRLHAHRRPSYPAGCKNSNRSTSPGPPSIKHPLQNCPPPLPNATPAAGEPSQIEASEDPMNPNHQPNPPWLPAPYPPKPHVPPPPDRAAPPRHPDHPLTHPHPHAPLPSATPEPLPLPESVPLPRHPPEPHQATHHPT